MERERFALPRGYIANLIFTIVGQPFKDWVDKIVRIRHADRRSE